VITSSLLAKTYIIIPKSPPDNIIIPRVLSRFIRDLIPEDWARQQALCESGIICKTPGWRWFVAVASLTRRPKLRRIKCDFLRSWVWFAGHKWSLISGFSADRVTEWTAMAVREDGRGVG